MRQSKHGKVVRRNPVYARIAVFVLAAGVTIAAPVAALSASLASYRAVYDLNLREADDRSGIANVEGRLVTEYDGDDCEGYTLNMRRVLRINTTNGTSSMLDALMTSWESGSGNEMQFGSRQYMDSRLIDDVAGGAETGRAEADGQVHFTSPNESEMNLPADAVFPTEHAKRIIEAALRGDTIERSIVFDGAELNKIYTAVSFIGTRLEPGEAEVVGETDGAQNLRELPAWPVTVSYFEDTAEDIAEQLPAYELTVTMFENGVVTDLVLAYEGFSLTGTLSSIELYERGGCN